MSFWLAFRLAPALIMLSVIFYALWLRVPIRRTENLARGSLLLAVFCEIGGLILLSMSRSVAAPAGQGESMLVLSGAFALLYLYVEWRAGESGMGAFAASLSLVFALAAALRGPAAEIPELLREHWFAPHATLILFSFASFTMSAVVSMAYVVQYRRLRQKKLDGWGERLPALEILDKMSRRSTRIGFFLLTAGLIVGMILAQSAWGEAWSWDPKQCMTLLTWMLYGASLYLRRQRDWQGERVAAVNLIAFGSLIFGLGVLYLFFESAHSFG